MNGISGFAKIVQVSQGTLLLELMTIWISVWLKYMGKPSVHLLEIGNGVIGLIKYSPKQWSTICVYVHACVSVCLCMHACLCVACMHMCVYTCVHVRLYVPACVCMCVVWHKQKTANCLHAGSCSFLLLAGISGPGSMNGHYSTRI